MTDEQWKRTENKWMEGFNRNIAPFIEDEEKRAKAAEAWLYLLHDEWLEQVLALRLNTPRDPVATD